MQQQRLLFIIEIAILTALALVLDLLPFLKFKIWPAGGSISFAMIPVFIAAFRWGLKGGIASGFLWGILQIAVGDAYILNFWQGLIEYGFAFTVLGLAGIVTNQVQEAVRAKDTTKTIQYVILGVVIGGSGRFLAHFIAGFIFFAEYAPEGQPAWLYSLIYNSSYMIPAMLLSIIIIAFLFVKQPRLLLTKRA